MARRTGSQRTRGSSRKPESGRKSRGSSKRRSKRRGKIGYKPLTSQTAQERRNMAGGDRDYAVNNKFPAYRAADKNSIRILPMPESVEDTKYYAIDAYIHYGIGVDEAQYLCLKKMKKEDCPICEEADRARKEGDNDYAGELKATHRPVCMIVDRRDNDTVKVWPMPWTVDKEIMNVAVDDDTKEVLNIVDLYEGYDITFDRSGSGQRVKYGAPRIARKATPVFDDDGDIDEMMEKLDENPLPMLLEFHDYDHIARAFGHSTSSNDDDEPDDDYDDEDNDDNDDDDRGSDLTWDEVNDMDFDDLCDIVEENDVDIDLADYEDDADDIKEIIAAICDELDIEKPRKSKKKARSRNTNKARRMHRRR